VSSFAPSAPEPSPGSTRPSGSGPYPGSALAPDRFLGPVIHRLRAAGCVFAEEEAELLVTSARSPAELAGMVDRRMAGHPLEHILGWAEFRGLRIAVDEGVFVPRRRTEHLVRLALDLVDPVDAVVVDLCCGSGAVAAAIAAAAPGAEVHAADLDPAAVRCTRRNLRGRRGRAHVGDLYDALPANLRGRVDVLIANAPYVPTDAIDLMPPEAREHEPRLALDGGPDGLSVLRRVLAGAPPWLAPGGHLLLETSAGQAPLLLDAVTLGGLTARVDVSADLGATVIVASLPRPG